MSAQNKKVVEDFIQALFTRGELEAVDEYLAPEFVDHNPTIPGQTGDRESMRSAGALFRAAFPDWRSTVEDLIAADDMVVERFTARGTHQGELMHIPATGRAVALSGINIFRLRDGKIVERWGSSTSSGSCSNWARPRRLSPASGSSRRLRSSPSRSPQGAVTGGAARPRCVPSSSSRASLTAPPTPVGVAMERPA